MQAISNKILQAAGEALINACTAVPAIAFLKIGCFNTTFPTINNS